MPGLTIQNPIALDQDDEGSAPLTPPHNPEQIVLMSDSSSEGAAAALPVLNPEEIILMSGSGSSDGGAAVMLPAAPLPNPEEVLPDGE